MRLLHPALLIAPCAAFLLLAACQGAPPFKNMTVAPIRREDCKALCLLHGGTDFADSLWFVDQDGQLCPTKFPKEFSGLHWILPSPDHERIAIMGGCEGCFDLSVFRLCDGLGASRNGTDWAKPICSIDEYRYHPVDVHWVGNHELRFSAEWVFPRPADGTYEDLPLRHWKWDIDSDKIEEVK